MTISIPIGGFHVCGAMLESTEGGYMINFGLAGRAGQPWPGLDLTRINGSFAAMAMELLQECVESSHSAMAVFSDLCEEQEPKDMGCDMEAELISPPTPLHAALWNEWVNALYRYLRDTADYDAKQQHLVSATIGWDALGALLAVSMRKARQKLQKKNEHAD